MTPEQTVAFIEILNQNEVLRFSGENPVMLNLGVGATVEIWADGTQHWFLNGEEVTQKEHNQRTTSERT